MLRARMAEPDHAGLPVALYGEILREGSMNTDRSIEIERAVSAGLARWSAIGSNGDHEDTAEPEKPVQVVRPMPRRARVHSIDVARVTLPMARRETFDPGVIRPILRMLVWVRAVAQFFGADLIDRLAKRSTIQRRAARLRRIFEETGATFTKLGQQLSLRADLLPYEYCAELSKMLDQGLPLAAEEAIAIIERGLARPLHEIFEIFDPEPIGSASLACVYQAKLRTGEKVAVKIRRPGIGLTLAADLRALEWIMIAAEALTIIRPGLTKELRRDLRSMLMGELNFRAEARYTEMFRLRTAKEDDGLTANKVFFEFCTNEILVNEFASGIWVWELMAAVDRDDQEFLDKARDMGIEPAAVARRLAQAVHRELLEHLFFHADPHPANLVVLPGGRICFIDFGAVGRFSTETRQTWRELQYHMRNLDIARMVRCSISLAGRLPPIDVDKVMGAMEEIYADWVYAVSSTDAEWWERSTAQNWLRYVHVARENGIPVSLETIQFFRATLLYDSILARLDKDLDPVEQYAAYAKKAGRAARKRIQKSVRQRSSGPTAADYLQIEQLSDTAAQIYFRLRRSVEDPVLQFRYAVGKLSYGLSLLIKIFYAGVTFALLGLVAQFVLEKWSGKPFSFSWHVLSEWVTKGGWFYFGALVLALVLMRRLLIRLSLPDKKPD